MIVRLTSLSHLAARLFTSMHGQGVDQTGCGTLWPSPDCFLTFLRDRCRRLRDPRPAQVPTQPHKSKMSWRSVISIPVVTGMRFSGGPQTPNPSMDLRSGANTRWSFADRVFASFLLLLVLFLPATFFLLLSRHRRVFLVFLLLFCLRAVARLNAHHGLRLQQQLSPCAASL